MLSTEALRDQMDRYASGEISAESLEEWLVAESWDMRRWAPIGLQHLVEAIQAAFIDYSDGKISEEAIGAILLQRRDQLHRAREVTRKVEQSRPEPVVLDLSRPRRNTLAESQALMLSSEAVAV
jgi:hypothetical protein